MSEPWADLHRRYVELLLDRLSKWPMYQDSTRLCDRIERNLEEWRWRRAVAPLAPPDYRVVWTEPARNIPVSIPEPAAEPDDEPTPASVATFLAEPFGPEAAPSDDAVPAPFGSAASGAPADQRPVLDGGSVKPAAPVLVPMPVERLAAGGHAPPKDPKKAASGALGGKARALGAAKVTCEGCRGEYFAGPGITGHRRHCADYQREIAPRVRVIPPLPIAAGIVAPGGTDPLAARADADAKFHGRAAAKAAAGWDKRHGGEVVR